MEAKDWQPDLALSVVEKTDPAGDDGPTTYSVRHPTAPFEYTIKTENAQTLLGLARNYLKSLAQLLGDQALGRSLSQVSEKAGSTNALELALLPADDGHNHWKSTFWFERGAERTQVISAAPSGTDEPGSGIGIRLIAQVVKDQPQVRRITSMSACLPRGTIVRLVSASHPPRATGGPTSQPQGSANLTAGSLVFRHDPVSQAPKHASHTLRARRPTGDEKLLEQYREEYELQQPVAEAQTELRRIEPSRFVREDQVGPFSQPPDWPDAQTSASASPLNVPVRSNSFSKITGSRNPLRLFEHFADYGIDRARYFRSARLPLEVHYRSGMPYGPGKDGQTVNAAVQPKGWRRHQIAPDYDQEPPQLALHLALANLSHRGRKSREGQKPAPAEPMGIGADPRWMWHEFGHILLMATTGELEMRFAHSLGDALAAIVSDPESDLAVEDDQNDRRRWRGATFPWVFLPRRHDRCVYHGWSWSGAMHRSVRELPDRKQPRRKGYRSEQILSTSLFRLYLCLGGETTKPGKEPSTAEPDTTRRLTASDYTLFLIMKGLALLGDARIVPANHPDQLVCALIDADIGTEEFEIDGEKRIGGCAHKVIRWAFEAQGLYADGSTDNNNIGRPPEVDIYIEDGRPQVENWLDAPVKHGPGAYVPVSLETPKNGSAKPAWFAHQNTWEVDREDGNVHLAVTVGNRGRGPAEGVTVSVFWRKWDGSKLGDYELGNKDWVQFGSESGPKQIAAGKKVRFGQITSAPFPGDQRKIKRYLILIQTTCAADRANTDPLTGLPCSRTATPLVDLVANDNNLALIDWSP